MNAGARRWKATLESLRERVIVSIPGNGGPGNPGDPTLVRDVDIILRALSPAVRERMPMWHQSFQRMGQDDKVLFLIENVDTLTDDHHIETVDTIRCSLYPSMVRRAHDKELAQRMVDIASHGEVMLDTMGCLWDRLWADGALSPEAICMSRAAGYRMLEEIYREITVMLWDEMGKHSSTILKEADLYPPSGLDAFQRSPEAELSSLYRSCHLLVRAIKDFYGPEFIDHLYRFSD